MITAQYYLINKLPKKFYHDSLVKDNDGWTVAMFIAHTRNIKDLPLEF